MASPKTCTHSASGLKHFAGAKCSARTCPRACSRGYTLIELLVVIGLFATVAAFALVMSMDTYRGATYHSERDMVIAALQKARSQAISSVCMGAGCIDGKPHGVHFQTGQYIIFQGTSYSPSDPTNEIINARNKAVSIAGATDVVFSLLSATATAATLTFGDGFGHAASISIGSEGQISWTN